MVMRTLTLINEQSDYEVKRAGHKVFGPLIVAVLTVNSIRLA
jgi:hypothetical protein